MQLIQTTLTRLFTKNVVELPITRNLT